VQILFLLLAYCTDDRQNIGAYALGVQGRLFIGNWELYGDVEEDCDCRRGVGRVCIGLR
jgi:hypothetical protein